MMLSEQVQRLETDLAYLQTLLDTLLIVVRDVPGAMKPAIAEQIEKALAHTRRV